MIKRLKSIEQFLIFHDFIRWFLISFVVAFLTGTACAAFLASLDWVTAFREEHQWIIALLPIGGLAIGLVYHVFGKSVEGGATLIFEELHDPRDTIPFRMAPLVFLGTVATHFFGGSAGREGTAVQMGGSLADQLSGPLKLNRHDRRILLISGMSAGFAAVFGTPFAGAVFGLEVISVGTISYESILPCFLSGVIADKVTLAWGIKHTHYPVGEVPELGLTFLACAMIAGLAFGLISNFFSRSTHSLADEFKRRVKWAPLRPFIGGVMVAAAVYLMGTTKFIGLGIPTIVDSFTGSVGNWDFLIKFLFTTVTLAAGFKGGEVTPLFFIGATLGHSLSHILPLPAALLSAMGFVAVFAGAANTPLSSTFMAFELFGPQAGIYAGLACVVSFLFSGHAGIYHGQRFGVSKANIYDIDKTLSIGKWLKGTKVKLKKIQHDHKEGN